MKKTLLLVCTALFLSAPLKSFSSNQVAPNFGITPCMAAGLSALQGALDLKIDGEDAKALALKVYNDCVDAGGR